MSVRTRRRPPVPALVSLTEVANSVREVTRWPVIFRSAMVVSATSAAVLAAAGRSPMAAVLVVAGLALVLAGVGALLPESPAPLVFQLALVGEVVVTRSADQAAADGVVLIGVACLAYLHHATAAMAAALPWQASPRPSVLAAFAGRTGVILGWTVGVGVLVVAVTALLHGRGPSLLTFVGLVLAAAVGLLPALLLRRVR